VSEEGRLYGEFVELYPRARAYDLVKAALSEDDDRVVGAVDSIVAAVLDESGVERFAEVVVELSLKLASAIERIATDQGVAAVDLAVVWFQE
jgi:hypothetical protein